MITFFKIVKIECKNQQLTTKQRLQQEVIQVNSLQEA